MPLSLEKALRATRNAALRNPLILLGLAAMAGILLIDSGRPLFLLLVPVLFPVAGGIFLWRSRREMATLLIAAGLVPAGYGVLHQQRIMQIQSFPFARALAGNERIDVSGQGWLAERPRSGERSTTGILHLENLIVGETSIPCDHRVPVSIAGRTENFHYGAALRFSGRLRPLETAGSPGGFDPAAFYYRSSGSLGRLEIRAGDSLEILAGRKGNPIIAFANRTRDTLEKGLLLGIDPEDESYGRLITAMSLGARENSPEDLEEWFRLSGTMHIFAVSGLHVGILAGLFLGLFLALGIPRRRAILILLPLLLFYAVMTGLRPSAIRAAVMLSIFLGAFVVKEKPGPLNHLGFAALFLLLFDTQQLFLPGFQLSFAVLFSITLLAGPVQRWTAAPWLTDPFLPKSLHGPLRRGKDHVVRAFAAALAVSLVSWFGSLGLLVWHFQSFSPIGIVANLFLVPMVGVIVTLAVASLIGFGFHLTWITAAINQANVALAILLTSMAQFFAELPGAHRHAGRGLVPETEENVLTLDVMGQRGDMATLWGWPTPANEASRWWVVDPGGAFTYRQELLPLLRSRSVNRIEALGLTHGDIGHIEAAPEVMTQLQPGLLLEPAGPNRSRVYPEIEAIRDRQGIRSIELVTGMRLRPTPDTVLEVLSPGLDASDRIADDRALVLRLEFGEWRVLLTSDIGFSVEKALLASGIELKSDVWIRGQHAETASGLPSFVDAVAPKVVISTHADFPSSESLSTELREQLSEQGIPLLTLDETGVVSLELEPSSLSIHAHQAGSRLRISSPYP